jgi:hypothetical protein
MNVNWKGNHAEVGPFKLNIYANQEEDLWEWQASTPGFVGKGWAAYNLASEAEARAAAEQFVVEQLMKFLDDLGIQQPIVVRAGKVEATPVLGRCAVCGHPESAPAHHLPPSQKGPPWYRAWDHPFVPKEVPHA